MSEKLSSQEAKRFALEWLVMVVANHFVGGTIVNFNVSFFNLVCQIKVSNVEGRGAFR